MSDNKDQDNVEDLELDAELATDVKGGVMPSVPKKKMMEKKTTMQKKTP